MILLLQAAVFQSLTAWNCDKGAEAVNAGSLQFHDFVLVHNDLAGYEGKKVTGNPPRYNDTDGPGLFSSLIVSHFDERLTGGATKQGLVLPYMSGFLVKDVEFWNFNKVKATTFYMLNVGNFFFFSNSFDFYLSFTLF